RVGRHGRGRGDDALRHFSTRRVPRPLQRHLLHHARVCARHHGRGPDHPDGFV
ncbi:hypothetical protein T484DRAFT_1912712, partial [Baffinella frigidus]